MRNHHKSLVALPKDQEPMVFSDEQLRDMMKSIQVVPLPLMLSLLEKKMIYAVLQANRWCRTEAAKVLGMSRHALDYRMERFGITKRVKPDVEVLQPEIVTERPVQAERVVRSGGKLINIEVGIKIEL